MSERTADIDRARDALARDAWAEAFDALHDADPARLSPRDLEGLADAAWWLSRWDESIAARQRAFTGYAAAGDDPQAASTRCCCASTTSNAATRRSGWGG